MNQQYGNYEDNRNHSNHKMVESVGLQVDPLVLHDCTKGIPYVIVMHLSYLSDAYDSGCLRHLAGVHTASCGVKQLRECTGKSRRARWRLRAAGSKQLSLPIGTTIPSRGGQYGPPVRRTCGQQLTEEPGTSSNKGDSDTPFYHPLKFSLSKQNVTKRINPMKLPLSIATLQH